MQEISSIPFPDSAVSGHVVACHRCAEAATRLCPTCRRSFCAQHCPATAGDCPNCARARQDNFLVAILGASISMACMHTHVDFRDKTLKILGSIAKVAAVVQTDSKDVRNLASELSRVRKWLKFMKILRMYKANVKAMSNSDNLRRLEIAADFAQMISEDISTLHRSGAWTGLTRFPIVKDIGVWEDRAWCVWATLAFVNSLRDLEISVRNYAAAEDEIKQKKTKLIGCLLNSLKFACEIGDSTIALLPVEVKRTRDKQLTLCSALLGGTSAVCSIHKFLYPSYY